MTIVIIGVAVTALIAGLATVGNAGTANRTGVVIDNVMRNYAEATKSAAAGCVAGSTYTVSYAPPTGYHVAVSPTGGVCPAVTTTQRLTLTVTSPTGSSQSMDIKVRTP